VLNKIDGVFGPNDEDLLQSIAASVSIANENVRLYGETVSMAEHERDIRHMFQKFVPKEIVDKIVHEGESSASRVEELKTLTLINIDLRGFSKLAVNIGPQKTIALLNHFFSVMGGIIFTNLTQPLAFHNTCFYQFDLTSQTRFSLFSNRRIDTTHLLCHITNQTPLPTSFFNIKINIILIKNP